VNHLKKIIAVFISVCVTIIAVMPVKAEEMQLYAQSAVLIDADSGRVLYGKDSLNILPMASTTKIMTCIIALENGDLSNQAEVSAYAVSQPKVHLGVREGETYRLEDLLYSLMLESHNDSAVIIAENVGGSVEGFAALMNQKAQDIGCGNTYFITPNGLDGQDSTGTHSTTAEDLARIMRYCIKESPKKDKFLEITGTSSYTFSDVSGSRNFSCVNHNAFLNMMDGALTGKTGFTGNAGYCYVGALERDGKCFIVALLACGWPNNKNYKWSDTRKLMEYGLENYEYRDEWQEPKLQPLPVTDGIPSDGSMKGTAYARAVLDVGGDEKSLNYLLNKDEKIEMTCEMKSSLKAPVEKGNIIGYVSYRLGDDVIRKYPIRILNAVEKIDYPWCLKKMMERFTV